MKYCFSAVFAVGIACSSAPTGAQNIKAAELKVMMASYIKVVNHDPSATQADFIAGSAGIGYVEGVMDTEHKSFCGPPMTQREIATHVSTFLSGLQGTWDNAAASDVVLLQLRTIYPCPVSKQTSK